MRRPRGDDDVAHFTSATNVNLFADLRDNEPTHDKPLRIARFERTRATVQSPVAPPSRGRHLSKLVKTLAVRQGHERPTNKPTQDFRDKVNSPKFAEIRKKLGKYDQTPAHTTHFGHKTTKNLSQNCQENGPRPGNPVAPKGSGIGSKTYPRTAAVALCGRKIAAPPKVLGSALKTIPEPPRQSSAAGESGSAQRFGDRL